MSEVDGLITLPIRDSSVEVGRVEVGGGRPYQVVVGRGILSDVGSQIPTRSERVAIIHAPALAGVALLIAEGLAGGSRDAIRIEVPEGESAKTVETAAEVWKRLGDAGFTRTDCVVGLGGGATTDLAGFVAATWLRGVDIIQVPTTLLAMVDAAVGGKTGINSPAGKNLIGSIHPPRGVICDLDFLRTLPTADYSAGLAEVIKAGFISDGQILQIVEREPSAVLDPSGSAVEDVILRAIRVKAGVVADDLTESVDRSLGREVLNYGHTLAHAIERSENYTWRHGDAVSIGMVFAAGLAVDLGRLDEEGLERHRRILTSVGLPVQYRQSDPEKLIEIIRLDKKTRGRVIRFIVLDGIGHPGLAEFEETRALHQAFRHIQ